MDVGIVTMINIKPVYKTISFSCCLCFIPFCYAEMQTLVVTADKTEQSPQDIPISLSVLTAEELQQRRIEDLTKLARQTPNFSFQSTGQSGFNPPVVRGLTSYATAFSSSVLLTVDGVPTLVNQGFEHNLIGVDRVEVLRGPQSAIYGKNAEAGVVNIYTRLPDNSPYARLDLEVGQRNKYLTRFDTSSPLIDDTLYASIQGQFYQQDGFINNRYTGDKADDRKNYYDQTSLRWTPTTADDIILRYSHLTYRDGAALWGSVNGPKRSVYSGTPSWNHSQGESVSLDVSHQFDSGITLRSITAHNRYQDKLKQDTDFLPVERFYTQRNYLLNTTSQEFRLSGKLDDSQWLAGLYFDKDNHHLSFTRKTPLLKQTVKPDQDGYSMSVFGQWMKPLNQYWTLTLGGRAEKDNIKITPKDASNKSQTWHEFSPKAALQYQLNTDTQIYLSYSQGFRMGGFNVFSPQENYPAYSPEKVHAYETGIKGFINDWHLGYSLAVYYMKINDMQVQQYITPGVVRITNAASANSKGIEGTLNYWINANWIADASIGINQTKFNRYRDGKNNYDDNKNPYAPNLTWHLGLRYDADHWFGDVSLEGVGKSYLDPANRYERSAYQLVNLSLGYRVNNQLTVTTYADNLFDKEYNAVGFMNGSVTVYSPPREIGMRVTYEF